MFIQKDMASRNVLSVLLRVCDKADDQDRLGNTALDHLKSSVASSFQCVEVTQCVGVHPVQILLEKYFPEWEGWI